MTKQAARPRARDLGLTPGALPPGPLNAITDISGVRVGQCTVWEGVSPASYGSGPARTGVTASGLMGTGLMHPPIKGDVITQAFGHPE